jgi:hypothetical protein
MTDRRPPATDQFLTAWFEDGPTRMPDRVLDVVAHRIGRERQRRQWRLPRRLFMNPYAKLAAAAAALVLVALVGYQLLPHSGIGGPAAPTPAPTVAPTPSAAAIATIAPSATPFPCQDDLPTCAGEFAAGTHTSALFRPAFTFSTPSGWLNSLDQSQLYEIDSAGSDYLLLWSGVAISQHTASCEPLVAKGLGNRVQDWIDFVTTHPGITASKPVPVTMGAARGQAVDLSIKTGWTKTCPGFRERPCSSSCTPTGRAGPTASRPGSAFA